MAQVLIRNIPDETLNVYRERAKRNGISLEQEIRNLLERNRPYTPEERVAVSEYFLARTQPSPPLTLDEIREGLE
ncbi:FitA-like ribbon-helix-helix domain-containing protein [Xanthobacter versatilis]|uniref:FitA-like ribbon-helix-helix domain-containing protein n=1 Tax=Xanthobacter autotrophicus (strain ATCC BAA-1158 / Py2) TaxID=78245 RepID=UPI0037272D3C